MKLKVALILVFIIWIVSGFIVITPFFGMGKYVFTTWGSCEPKFEGKIGFTNLLLVIPMQYLLNNNRCRILH